jgi:hypothetical protein
MTENREPERRDINTNGGNYNENIHGNYVQGNYFEGDTTTSAAQRAINAYEEIKSEINSNFVNLSLTIQAVENNSPQKFWDMRRANESELAYQDRAKNSFQEYINSVSTDIRLLKFSDAVYCSYQRDLSHHREIANHIKKTYEQLYEVRDYFARIEQGLRHNISLNLSDSERLSRSIFLHKEHVLNSKVSLMRSAAYFCLTLKEIIDGQILSAALEGADIAVSLQSGKEGYKTALSVASQLHHQKVIVLQESIAANEKEKTREIERRVTDPYLIMLREISGLSLTLSEGELFAIERKTINKNEKNPEELFKLATLSFLESDGHASIFYFEKSLEANTLSPIIRKFAQLSLNRLKYPEIYEESIGIMVMRLIPDGNFATAGLLEGDVIVSLNGKTINEPMDIASGLGKSRNSPVLVGVIRDDKLLSVVIKGGESAGAALSQLIMLNVFQL